MAFIRSKKVGVNTYYYLVESRRVGGKVRQITVAYMGKEPTIEGAYQMWKRVEKNVLESAPDWVRERDSDADDEMGYQRELIWQASPACEIRQARAKINREALESYRPKTVIQREAQEREERRQKRKASPRYQQAQAEREAKAAEWEARTKERRNRQRGLLSRAEYLRVLGLQEGASAKDIKAAYWRLAREHHPDVGGDGAAFRLINEAYNSLSRN